MNPDQLDLVDACIWILFHIYSSSYPPCKLLIHFRLNIIITACISVARSRSPLHSFTLAPLFPFSSCVHLCESVCYLYVSVETRVNKMKRNKMKWKKKPCWMNVASDKSWFHLCLQLCIHNVNALQVQHNRNSETWVNPFERHTWTFHSSHATGF